MSDDLNDDAIEAYLSGRAQDEPLGQLLASIEDRYASIPAPPPGPELAALMRDPLLDGGVVDRSLTRRRRKRVVAAALTGTVLGKVVIGVSVAAASVAGMQATGIVELAGLPGPHHGALGPSAPTTAASTSPTTTSTEPSIDPDFTRQLRARDAGTVVVAVADDALLWVRPFAASGWTHALEQQPTAALVTFRDVSGAVTVDVTIQGEFLHVVVVDQRDGSSEDFWFDGDGRPTDDPTQPAAPPDPPEAPAPPSPAAVDDDDTVGDDVTIEDDRDQDDDHADEHGDDHETDRHDDEDESDDDQERSWSDDTTQEPSLVDDDDSPDDDEQADDHSDDRDDEHDDD